MADFNVKKREVGAVTVIDVNGYLDAHTAPELETVFDNLVESKNYKTVVNLSELKYISSAGLGVFMAYVETMRENNGDIKFCNLKDDVYNVFDLLGFPMLYEFYKTEEEAIAKYDKV